MNFTPTLGIQAMNLLAEHLGFSVPSASIISKIRVPDHKLADFGLEAFRNIRP